MRGIEQIPWLYDGINWLFERTGFLAWRRWLVGGARGHTLEVGVGTGRNLPHYPPGSRVVGLERDRGVMRVARRRAPRMPLVVGRAEALPFPAATFDTVVSGLVFCTVSDPRRGLAEVRRVLKPDGCLRMLEHVRSTNRFWAKWQDVIQPVHTMIAGGCHANRDTERTVEAEGFVIEPEGRRASGTLRRFSARPAPVT